jgi:hypothetical protein
VISCIEARNIDHFKIGQTDTSTSPVDARLFTRAVYRACYFPSERRSYILLLL